MSSLLVIVVLVLSFQSVVHADVQPHSDIWSDAECAKAGFLTAATRRPSCAGCQLLFHHTQSTLLVDQCSHCCVVRLASEDPVVQGDLSSEEGGGDTEEAVVEQYDLARLEIDSSYFEPASSSQWAKLAEVDANAPDLKDKFLVVPVSYSLPHIVLKQRGAGSTKQMRVRVATWSREQIVEFIRQKLR